MTNQERVRLPIYEGLIEHDRKKGRDTASCLTVPELIEQTHQFMLSFDQLIKNQEMPDSIFFLDKSARPLAYMFKRLFPAYYPDQSLPKIRYVNIGKGGGYDTYSQPFRGDPSILSKTYGTHINPHGRILIVDEYTETGESIRTAESLFQRAFSDAKVGSKVAYSKYPIWQNNDAYLWVREYNKEDYQQIAVKEFIEQYNLANGTNLKDYEDILNHKSGDGGNLFYAWRNYYQSLWGTIPYVKRGRSLQPVREELDAVCNEILKTRKANWVKPLTN